MLSLALEKAQIVKIIPRGSSIPGETNPPSKISSPSPRNAIWKTLRLIT